MSCIFGLPADQLNCTHVWTQRLSLFNASDIKSITAPIISLGNGSRSRLCCCVDCINQLRWHFKWFLWCRPICQGTKMFLLFFNSVGHIVHTYTHTQAYTDTRTVCAACIRIVVWHTGMCTGLHSSIQYAPFLSEHKIFIWFINKTRWQRRWATQKQNNWNVQETKVFRLYINTYNRSSFRCSLLLFSIVMHVFTSDHRFFSLSESGLKVCSSFLFLLCFS